MYLDLVWNIFGQWLGEILVLLVMLGRDYLHELLKCGRWIILMVSVVFDR
ncbi:MAG: hypothetical protein U1C19_08210 [Methanobacteriaceae archaeon]|nr:hypothetical protein [Methanobacteriaceae archaeon]